MNDDADGEKGEGGFGEVLIVCDVGVVSVEEISPV